MERVKVHDSKGMVTERTGIGIFARVLMEAKPLLLVVEETWLNDPVLREDFFTRVLVYHSSNFSRGPRDVLLVQSTGAKRLSEN